MLPIFQTYISIFRFLPFFAANQLFDGCQRLKLQASGIGLLMVGRIIEQGSFLPGLTAGFAGCAPRRALGPFKMRHLPYGTSVAL